MTGRAFRMVLVWLLIAAGGWSYAQEAQDEQDPPVQPTSEAHEEEVGNADASPEVFIPTEEISEDAAVPFPVDI